MRFHTHRGRPLHSVLTLTLLVVSAPLSVAVAQSPSAPATPGMPVAPTSSSQPGPIESPDPVFDRAFIDMMVPHHESAVAMAQVALARAEHPELRQMATKIIVAQEMEIAELRLWRKDWYGSLITPPITAMPVLPGVEVDGMAMDAVREMDMGGDVRDLWSAEPFDIAFIDAMIPHHQSAIDAAQLAVDRAEHSRIKKLAQSIVDSQQAEIDQLREWRDAWFR